MSSRCPLCNSPGRFSFKSRDLRYNKTQTYQYMQCKHCGAVYQDPMPTPAEIASFYPDHYTQYRQLSKQKRPGYAKVFVLHHKYGYSHLDVPRLPRVLASILALFRYRDAIRFVPNGKALDIGCGNGKFIRAMNSLGWRFEGVEFNSIAVDACRNVGLKVFHGDLQTAPFEDNSFDLISARHMIEHVPDSNNLMGEIARILKKGGRLVIRTPNSNALGRRWFGTLWSANEVPRHLVLFSPDNLHMLTERHGLQFITEKTFTTPKIILRSWDYLTENRGKPSQKYKLRRIFARLYVVLSTVACRGDEVFAIYEKP